MTWKFWGSYHLYLILNSIFTFIIRVKAVWRAVSPKVWEYCFKTIDFIQILRIKWSHHIWAGLGYKISSSSIWPEFRSSYLLPSSLSTAFLSFPPLSWCPLHEILANLKCSFEWTGLNGVQLLKCSLSPHTHTHKTLKIIHFLLFYTNFIF